MDIFCCTDTNFVIPLGVMLYSLCVNNKGEDLHFNIIIDNTVTEQQKEELQSVVNGHGDIYFYLINIESIKKYLVVKVENFPVPIYYRLLVAKILPETIHKVLYLDADMVIRHDLSELWNVSLSEKAIAAIPNQSDCGHYWDRLEYEKSLGYFNSGVLLLNLDYIREQLLTDHFVNYIKNNPEKLLCPDQDALNYVLKDCKLMLPVRYNAQEGFYRIPPEKVFDDANELEKEITDPYIVHYTKEKPWAKDCKHPLKNLYYYYKAFTPWADNDYMERFKYERLHIPFLLKMKLLIVKALSYLKKERPTEIVYKAIDLEK